MSTINEEYEKLACEIGSWIEEGRFHEESHCDVETAMNSLYRKELELALTDFFGEDCDEYDYLGISDAWDGLPEDEKLKESFLTDYKNACFAKLDGRAPDDDEKFPDFIKAMRK